MNRDYAIGFIVIALLMGGIFLLARRPATITNYTSSTAPQHTSGNIRLVADVEPKRYQNKEIRETEFEYNSDGSFSKLKMVITRDYAIT